MPISIEQIHELAPDQRSVAAAQQLVLPRLWEQTGLSDTAIWGVCGGGRNYQVKVDLEDLASSCNCPSRKFPCKHVLALLMLLVATPDAFVVQEQPTWVRDWLIKRKERLQKQHTKKSQPKQPVDAASHAKRVSERESKVTEGLEQLTIWLEDLIRSGVAAVESKPFSYWDDQARRLVDAQAKGLANRVRRLAEIPRSSRSWPLRMMEELGRLRLLVHAYENVERLSAELQSEVRQLVGWTVSQAELEATGELIEDQWLIFGQRIEEEERFRTQRSWAIGLHSKREALLLQFAPGNQGFVETIVPGSISAGKLLFYPGAVRQRAKFQTRDGDSTAGFADFPFQSSIAQFLDDYACRLALNPWLSTCTGVFEEVTLACQSGNWFLRDAVGEALPLDGQRHFGLLAETGGNPVRLFGEWNGTAFTPMSYLFDDRFRVCT